MKPIACHIAFIFLIYSLALIRCCEIYRCSKMQLPENVCMYSYTEKGITYNEIAPNLCGDQNQSHYCHKSENCQYSFCVPNPDLNNQKYDKQECKLNDDCYSLKCINNICVGQSENEKCTDSSECKVGYYCEPLLDEFGICKKQKLTGEKCMNDYECDNDLGCQYGKCIPYLSLKSGVMSENYLLCQSLFALNKTCISTVLENNPDCMKFPQNSCNFLVPELDIKYKTDCFCSLSEVQLKYCPYDTQNLNWAKYRSDIIKYFNTDAKLRHTKMRYNFPEYVNKGRYLSAEYPLLEGSDECVVNWVLSNKSPPMD